MPRTHRPAFTLVEALILVGITAVLLAVWLTVSSQMRRHERMTQNATQLRGIHQSMITWTHSSKAKTVHSYSEAGFAGFYYPGIDWVTGQVFPDGPATENSGDGSHPAARLAPMCAGNYFTPDYVISPADSVKQPVTLDADGQVVSFTSDNYSYAMLSLPGSEQERAEWTETLNPAAVVLGDRAIGTGPDDISSAWTRRGTGVWRGHVGRNDNSVEFVDSAVVNDTRYGDGEVNPRDDLFTDDPAADDALLVHEDATTAYSSD